MKCLFVFLSLVLTTNILVAQPYDNAPYTGDRVQLARSEKESYLRSLFYSLGLDYPSPKIFLRAFKRERTLEVWAYHNQQNKYVLVKTYINCQLSGLLGPKRFEGDLQVPEGFYVINEFNPLSDYFLSMGINYPNASDRILSPFPKLGGDIYIHGSCASIGCIPITDEYIKELYLICKGASQYGQENIPVHIFPFEMSVDNMRRSKREYCDAPELYYFWENLMSGYLWFENSRLVPSMKVQDNGLYYINYN